MSNFAVDNLQWTYIGPVVLYTITAAVTDLRTRKIPNWLTVGSFVFGLLYNTVAFGWQGIGISLGGFATGFGILLVLWLIGGGGGGDVKLMGALGAWLGWKHTVIVFLASAAFTAIASTIAIVWLITTNGLEKVRRRYFSRPTATKSKDPEEQKKQLMKRRLVPYAVPVALSTWLVLAWQVVVHKSH